jgi:hypothetical protein
LDSNKNSLTDVRQDLKNYELKCEKDIKNLITDCYSSDGGTAPAYDWAIISPPDRLRIDQARDNKYVLSAETNWDHASRDIDYRWSIVNGHKNLFLTSKFEQNARLEGLAHIPAGSYTLRLRTETEIEIGDAADNQDTAWYQKAIDAVQDWVKTDNKRVKIHTEKIFVIDVYKSVPIGIDLGTTFSCVGVAQRGVPLMLKADPIRAKTCIPSVVYFPTNSNEQILVGFDALEMIYLHPKQTFRDSKRFLGRTKMSESTAN